MRTEESFAASYKEAVFFTSHHKKPVWLVPTENKYELSVIKPKPSEVAKGSRAVLYDKDMNIIDYVKNY
jgi:hypothetical protein